MNLKYDTNEPIYETGNRLTDKESRPVVAKRESVRGGMQWDGGVSQYKGVPGGSDGKESACNAGDVGLIPGSGRSPESGMATHAIFLPGAFHGQRSLVGYSPWSCKESDTTEQLTFSLSLSMIYRMDKPQGPTVEHRGLYSITYDKP